ncbi:MAG TPA: UDP-N-acetylmuramoyl-L-alanyl-D-glutamate--2,6-diaminopimelate ligase [Methylomirabilota bacterium]|jgi:UDP-N-acetylmuramoyl-L-alanyl-D-glutamate--2,6-diaminopimelate ligase|nr:UDP-N-acetylmuramoyl-L-alanyl-D-glutamate--2,6-diaminopimelate ligase [Methylomirabilota bacterium]
MTATVSRIVPLANLLRVLPERELQGPMPTEVGALTDDSRRVSEGACFVAVRGLRTDGHRFIPQAVERGARAIVAEPPDPLPGRPVGRILVPDSRWALPRLADAYYGHPSRALTVVGITGTNGKTTTSYLVEALLRARGLDTGVVGTIQYVIRGAAREASQTTPEALELQELLADMVAAGVGGVAMEVSSHALDLRRVDGIAFDIAIFTNLTQDHLDFHGTMERYAQAKGRLFFELLPEGGKPDPTAILNTDDPVGAAWATRLGPERGVRVLTFGLGAGRAVRARGYDSDLAGIRLDAETPAGPLQLASPLIGEHNVMNLLGAVAAGVALGLTPDAIGRALGGVGSVPGRFERVEAGQEFLVVVDYAHTPDALRRVLETSRRLTPGRLGVVFGAGGDRDRGKRPIMGRIAADLADRVWLTSDNPRSEDPRAIIGEISVGVVPPPPGGYTSHPDRREAIRDALGWGRAGDTLVIAGKGHETYQIVAGQVFPFDDRQVVREILSEPRGAQGSERA